MAIKPLERRLVVMENGKQELVCAPKEKGKDISTERSATERAEVVGELRDGDHER